MKQMKQFLICILFILMYIGYVQNSSELTVWIRAGGPTVKTEIASFVNKILEILPENISSEILICTNENDVILEDLYNICKNFQSVRIIFSDLSSFSSALNSLAKHTNSASNVLTLSVGTNIRKDQIQIGLKNLTDRVKVYGWEITDYGNDGSCPGKGWYNTAALLHKTIVKQMKEKIPSWVDNGVLGITETHIIGGNEEIPIMIEALQRENKARFILNTSDPVSSNLKIGTEVSFNEKLKRKVVVGKYYMQKLHQDLKIEMDFESWSKNIWASLEIM